MARPSTAHYGIAKYGPQGTGDPMGVYSVYNPAMDTIDKIVFDLGEVVDAIGDRVTVLEGDVNEIKQNLSQLEQTVTNMHNEYDRTIQDIINKFYGGGSVDGDGNVDWGAAGKAAVGNLNVYGGGADASAPNAIRTRADSTSNENDVQVI